MNGLIQSSFIYDLCQVDTAVFESVFFRSIFTNDRKTEQQNEYFHFVDPFRLSYRQKLIRISLFSDTSRRFWG